MFKLSAAKDYLWPVRVKQPVDGGKWETHTFRIRFRVVGNDELRELRDDGDTDDVFLKKLIVGWADVYDAEGNDLPFSESGRDELINDTTARIAILQSFWESVGGERRKTKNS